jgi:ABC-type branched-subunit amino acid transport system permease subunit
MVAFGLGTGLTAFGGGIILSYSSVSPTSGAQYVVLMFTVVVLGGLGSVMGAIIGGVAVGIIQSLSTLVMPSGPEPGLVRHFHCASHLPPAGPARRRIAMTRSLIIIAVVAALALVAGAMLDPRGYVVRVVCLMLLAASLGQCWNIVGGLANQISLGHAAFFGIGAYTSTILQLRYGISPWFGMLAGAAIAGVVGLLISIPTMRLKGSYFALATLAFGEACRIFATAATGLTGGPQESPCRFSAIHGP